MSGKISQYTTTAVNVNPDDFLDISIDNGDGTFTSARLPGSVLLSLVTGGVNLGTGDLLQTDMLRFYEGMGLGSKLEFNKLQDFIVRATTAKFTADVEADFDVSVGNNLITSQAVQELGLQVINSSPATGDENKTIWAVDTSSSAITINLPTAATFPGQRILVGDYSGNAVTNTITLIASGSETINGQANITISRNYGWLYLYSSGTNWYAVTQDGNGNSVTGWAQYTDNGLITTTVANTPEQLQLAKDVIIENELPEGIATYWNDSSYFIPGRLNDGITAQLSFEAEPLANNLWLDVWLDLGGSFTKIYAQTFTFPKGSGTVRNIVYALPSLFQGSTWVANGAKIRIESNGAIEISNARLNITRVHKG
jgi:hypothetical protein